MLKFENAAGLMDCIKAYDHQPRPDAADVYVVGRVIGKCFGKQFHHYEIEVIACSHDQYDVDQIVKVPFEIMRDFDGRVTKWMDDDVLGANSWTDKSIRDWVRDERADQEATVAIERSWATA